MLVSALLLRPRDNPSVLPSPPSYAGTGPLAFRMEPPGYGRPHGRQLNVRSLRHISYRRRPGWPGRWVLPVEAGPGIRDSRRSSAVGDNWRNRYDSLRLFTPAKYDGLPGMPFPASAYAFPTAGQVADYLEHYAASMRLPVRNNVNGGRAVARQRRRRFRRDRRRAAFYCGAGGYRDRDASVAVGASIRLRTRSSDSPVPLQRVPQSGPAGAWRGARRRRWPLRRGYRP